MPKLILSIYVTSFMAHPILFPLELDMRRVGSTRRLRRSGGGCTRRRPRTSSATARSPGWGILSLHLVPHRKSRGKQKIEEIKIDCQE